MSTRTVAAELDISVGNITYYYPSKDDLLSILVNSLCKFQRKLIEDEAEDGISSVMAVCLELMTMASACESNPVAKDFFISSYQSPVTLKIIRENDNPKQALTTAVDIILSFLVQQKSFEAQAFADLQELA